MASITSAPSTYEDKRREFRISYRSSEIFIGIRTQ